MSISRASHVELDHEKDASKRPVSLSLRDSPTLMVDDRFSAHSTSDLRPEAVEGFVRRAVDATRVLEPDPDYRQLPFESMEKFLLRSWNSSIQVG